jgi:electron transfer flavoprotein alpha subunit
MLGGEALVNGGRDAALQAHEWVCSETEPAAVLLSKTDAGSDLGPRLAARLGAGLAQDCTSVGLDASGNLTATRPVYGGNAVARVSFGPGKTGLAIVRGKLYEPLEADPSRTGEIIESSPQIDPARVRVRSLRRVEQEATGIRLEDAAVVVSGGRGLGGPEPFEQLTELAGLLGGAVGASRAACDAGWIDHASQVGLTGKTITPELYITVGISGASQHMAGCSGSKNIVAINSDDSANIFKDSRYGVVGDWKAVLPAFLATVRELRDG